MNSLSEVLLDKIEGILSPDGGLENGFVKVFEERDCPERENQFLFFMKPELIYGISPQGRRRIFDIVFEAIQLFDMTVESVLVLGSDYLKRYAVMSDHYGVIHGTARNAARNMSQQARRRFTEIYGDQPGELPTLGGFDFLDSYPSFDADGLNKIWASHEFVKLGGGTYSELHRMDGRDIVMINGFYPNMLLHFTRTGRAIILFVLRSDTSWKRARKNFIGSTVPAQAEPGSIRNTLLVYSRDIGLENISPTYNGVHLSAGPVEGLVELCRFMTDRTHGGGRCDTERFVFGRRLMTYFREEELRAIMSNEVIERGDERISVFDFTEELDSTDALHRLRGVADQFRR